MPKPIIFIPQSERLLNLSKPYHDLDSSRATTNMISWLISVILGENAAHLWRLFTSNEKPLGLISLNSNKQGAHMMMMMMMMMMMKGKASILFRNLSLIRELGLES